MTSQTEEEVLAAPKRASWGGPACGETLLAHDSPLREPQEGSAVKPGKARKSADRWDGRMRAQASVADGPKVTYVWSDDDYSTHTERCPACLRCDAAMQCTSGLDCCPGMRWLGAADRSTCCHNNATRTTTRAGGPVRAALPMHLGRQMGAGSRLMRSRQRHCDGLRSGRGWYYWRRLTSSSSRSGGAGVCVLLRVRLYVRRVPQSFVNRARRDDRVRCGGVGKGVRRTSQVFWRPGNY